MNLARTAFVSGVFGLLAACATAPRMTTTDRLEFYRSHAGEPLRSFSIHGSLWGWRSIGDGALTVWTRRDQGFLLELAHRCPEMAFASSIGLSTRTGRVAAGFDSVIVPRRGAAGGPASCRIDTIRPVNTRVVKESRRDLHELDVLERDPNVTDEPQ